MVTVTTSPGSTNNVGFTFAEESLQPEVDAVRRNDTFAARAGAIARGRVARSRRHANARANLIRLTPNSYYRSRNSLLAFALWVDMPERSARCNRCRYTRRNIPGLRAGGRHEAGGGADSRGPDRQAPPTG